MIRSRALQHRHPGGPALVFPDLDLPQGGQLLLRGPSGSGKSTWLALAAALLRPAAGTLQVAGQDMAHLSAAEGDRWRARHVGLLTQRLHLSDALDVAQNLALVFYAAGLPHDTASMRRVMGVLNIDSLARRRPHQLSGGQAQRVALARALLLQPRVLLADEPTASLDDTHAQQALAQLAHSARQAGATLVIATHDARVVAALPEAEVLSLEAAA